VSATAAGIMTPGSGSRPGSANSDSHDQISLVEISNIEQELIIQSREMNPVFIFGMAKGNVGDIFKEHGYRSQRVGTRSRSPSPFQNLLAEGTSAVFKGFDKTTPNFGVNLMDEEKKRSKKRKIESSLR